MNNGFERGHARYIQLNIHNASLRRPRMRIHEYGPFGWRITRACIIGAERSLQRSCTRASALASRNRAEPRARRIAGSQTDA